MTQSRKISVIGLGYVGLPVAVAFGRLAEVIGFDINEARVTELRNKTDRTREVSTEELKESRIHFSSKTEDLRKADFHIVAVPTPIDDARRPDLSILLKASQTVGSILKKGDFVVFESTVYPGATEEDCIPVLERASGLKAGVDFLVGYSPERINPGDKERRFDTIKKVVSGQTPEATRVIADVYASVVKAGVFAASSIRVAEAAKVIENTQRDINIALMNELSLIFHRMGIDTREVLQAAGTKWNFLPFTPGLVGGHCIGVDPYYLTHKATQLGYIPQVILAGRKINDEMGAYAANQVIKGLIHGGGAVRGAKVAVLGVTFKENVPDVRNSKVFDLIRELEDFGVEVHAFDPHADAEEVHQEYHHAMKSRLEPFQYDGVVVAVAHREFAEGGWTFVRKLLGKKGFVADLKGLLNKDEAGPDILLWRL